MRLSAPGPSTLKGNHAGTCLEELDDIGGGITVRQVGVVVAFVGIGALALAVAPVAHGTGLAAASLGGGVLAAGGEYLLSQT